MIGELTPCPFDGWPREVDVDIDGGVEVCTNPACEAAWPLPGAWGRGEVRRRVRVVVAADRRGEL